jgi:hypothetical protein
VAYQHEIPTHLNVEDTVVLGLSIRQFAYLVVGVAGGYGLWNQWPDLPLAVRLGPAALWLLVAATFALLRPRGRGLEEWVFVAIHHLATPKRTVWRVPEPDSTDTDPSHGGWAELAPELSWEMTHASLALRSADPPARGGD